MDYRGGRKVSRAPSQVVVAELCSATFQAAARFKRRAAAASLVEKDPPEGPPEAFHRTERRRDISPPKSRVPASVAKPAGSGTAETSTKEEGEVVRLSNSK